jgi:RNA polymerase sigma-70 factor (ECF subfamily)
VDLQGQSREKVAASLGTTVNHLTVRLYRTRSAPRGRLQQTCLTGPIHGFFKSRCEYARRVRHKRCCVEVRCGRRNE